MNSTEAMRAIGTQVAAAAVRKANPRDTLHHVDGVPETITDMPSRSFVVQPVSGVRVPPLKMVPCADRQQTFRVSVFYESSPAGAERMSADSKLINDKLDAMVKDQAGFVEVTHDGGSVDALDAALVMSWLVDASYTWSD